MTNHDFKAQTIHTALCDVCGEHKSDIAHWERLGYSVGDLPSFRHSGSYSFKITDASRRPVLRLLSWPAQGVWGFIDSKGRPFALKYSLTFSSRDAALGAAAEQGLNVENAEVR